MKTFSFTLILITIVISVFAQEQSKISGTTPEKYNGKYVYLSKISPYSPFAQMNYIDSAYITKGRFIFNNELPPTDTLLYTLVLNNNTSLFVYDNENIKATYIEGNKLGYFQISGSNLNNSLNTIISYPHQIIEGHIELAKKRTELLTKNKWSLENEDAAKEEERIKAKNFGENVQQFVKNNIKNPAGKYIYLIYQPFFRGGLNNEVEAMLSQEEQQKIIAGKETIQNFSKSTQKSTPNEKQLNIGIKYIDFEGEMLSGDKVKLSTIVTSKKLVLLDFWASWCTPCLNEMPEIAKLHNNYKNDGLQIVGISLDKNRDRWKNAVNSFCMQWIQFIDSNLSNPISDVYGATVIPYTVLIDHQGNIIAIGLR